MNMERAVSMIGFLGLSSIVLVALLKICGEKIDAVSFILIFVVTTCFATTMTNYIFRDNK